MAEYRNYYCEIGNKYEIKINITPSGVVKEEDAVIVVEEKDFYIAAEKLVPSVTPRELAYSRALNTTSQRWQDKH